MTYINPLRIAERIAFAGDWHGNLTYGLKVLNHCVKNDVNTLIHVGDFGYLYDLNFVAGLNKFLIKHDMILLFIDGNHDNHDFLRALPFHSSGLRTLHSRMFYIPRGFRWEWEGISFLGLGGAHSVDKRLRISQGLHWWPNEVISYGEASKIIEKGHADIMITHDCPDGTNIPGLSPYLFPKEEIAFAEGHRRMLRLIVEAVTPRFLVHGHYHSFYQEKVELENSQCHVTGLDCDESPLRKNVLIQNLFSLKEEIQCL